MDNISKSNGITLLAINHGRFRGDLEILTKSGFKVYKMPYRWQTRIFHAYRNLINGDGTLLSKNNLLFSIFFLTKF